MGTTHTFWAVQGADNKLKPVTIMINRQIRATQHISKKWDENIKDIAIKGNSHGNLKLSTKNEKVLIRKDKGCIHKVLDQPMPFLAKTKEERIYKCNRR